MPEFPPPQLPDFTSFASPPPRSLKVFAIAVWVYIGAHALSTALMYSAVGAARDYAKDASLKQAFLDAVGPVNFASSIGAAAEICIAVTTLMWTYRTVRDVASSGVLLKFSPMLAMFSWVLPPVLFVFPLIMLRDLVTKTKNLRNDQSNLMKFLLTQWWVLYGLIPLVMSFFGAALTSSIPQSDQEMARALSDQIVPNTISAISLIGAAFLWRRIVLKLSWELSN